MADAKFKTTVTDEVIGVDVDEIKIRPNAAPAVISYRLNLTWSSGKVTTKEGTLAGDATGKNMTKWTMAVAHKKFLQALIDDGQEPDLVVQV